MATTTERLEWLLNPYDSAAAPRRGRGRSALSAGTAGLAAAGVLIGGGAAAWADEEPRQPPASADSHDGEGVPGALPKVVSEDGTVISPPNGDRVTLGDGKGNSFTFETQGGGKTDPPPAEADPPAGPETPGTGLPDPEAPSPSEAPAPEAPPEAPGHEVPSVEPSEPNAAQAAEARMDAEIAVVQKKKAARRYRINQNPELTEKQREHRLTNMRKQARQDIEKIKEKAAAASEEDD